MLFHKYHALGNDYIVLDPVEAPLELTPERIRRICHRNFGIGSDGILYGPIMREGKAPLLRIYNPDGSEAEKSGNGLRMFARFLCDTDRAPVGEEFAIETICGIVRAKVQPGGRSVTVEMGRVSFRSADIPVTGDIREAINEEIVVRERVFTYCAATIGNPHCVIPCQSPTEAMAREYGPHIEADSRFPNRTNVQFMEIIDRGNIHIEIWERGAGYTLASGSSSSASAAVAKRLGLCDNYITVHMPGGEIVIELTDDYAVKMTGGVTRVAEGSFFSEMF